MLTMCWTNCFCYFFPPQVGAILFSSFMMGLAVLGLLYVPFIPDSSSSGILVVAYMFLLLVAFSIALFGSLVESHFILGIGLALSFSSFFFWIYLTVPSLVEGHLQNCVDHRCGESHWMVPRNWEPSEKLAEGTDAHTTSATYGTTQDFYYEDYLYMNNLEKNNGKVTEASKETGGTTNVEEPKTTRRVNRDTVKPKIISKGKKDTTHAKGPAAPRISRDLHKELNISPRPMETASNWENDGFKRKKKYKSAKAHRQTWWDPQVLEKSKILGSLKNIVKYPELFNLQNIDRLLSDLFTEFSEHVLHRNSEHIYQSESKADDSEGKKYTEKYTEVSAEDGSNEIAHNSPDNLDEHFVTEERIRRQAAVPFLKNSRVHKILAKDRSQKEPPMIKPTFSILALMFVVYALTFSFALGALTMYFISLVQENMEAKDCYGMEGQSKCEVPWREVSCGGDTLDARYKEIYPRGRSYKRYGSHDRDNTSRGNKRFQRRFNSSYRRGECYHDETC